MKHFIVYEHPDLGSEAVKIGFSWPALFFGIVWMMVKQLWLWAGIWFVIAVVFNVVGFALSEAGSINWIVTGVMMAVWLWLWLYPAFKGNDWRNMNLEKKGYEYVADLEAESPEAAIAAANKAVQAAKSKAAKR